MKKQKTIYIVIGVLAAIALILGGVLLFSKISGDKAEIKELSKKTLEESITLTVKDEYKETIELTKNSTYLDPLDMVTISINGSVIDPKNLTDGKTSVICDTSTIDTSKNQAITVKYTVNATDEYDQEVSKVFSQIYTIKDTEKPVITLISESVSINNSQSYDPSTNVTVSDNHDTITKVNALSNGVAGFVVEGDFSNSKAGTYTMTVKAKDSDDNYADEKTFTITVKESTTNSNNNANTGNNTDANYGGGTDSQSNAYTYKVSQAIDETIAIRYGAGTMNNKVKYADLSADAQKYTHEDSEGYAYLMGNDTFTVYETLEDNASNLWARIDASKNAWVCVRYGDETWATNTD